MLYINRFITLAIIYTYREIYLYTHTHTYTHTYIKSADLCSIWLISYILVVGCIQPTAVGQPTAIKPEVPGTNSGNYCFYLVFINN